MTKSKHPFYRHLLSIPAISIALLFCQLPGISLNAQSIPELDNGYMKIRFDVNTGQLSELSYLKEAGGSLLDQNSIQRSPWEIVIGHDEQSTILNAFNAASFTFRKRETQLELVWSAFKAPAAGLRVIASISLIPDSAMSVWRIRLEGTRGLAISKLGFPRVSGIADLGNEELVAPDWMGSLLRSPRAELSSQKSGPRRLAWEYPGHMSMQFIALYNPNRFGLYLASNDSLAYSKNFSLIMDSIGVFTYAVDNFPPYDSHYDSYQMPYAYVIGNFRGDWMTASKMYKQWAVKQSWTKNSRLLNGRVPEWLTNTGYWEWNRGSATNVLSPAMALQKRLGVPVRVLWHWWHGRSYDDSFPEFFPPRDGKKVFIDALQKAQHQGVKALVYMNTTAWGTSTNSWTALHTEDYTVKDINGKFYSHVYNIFTKKALAHMCDGTAFWRLYYASLADTAINQYGVDGIYMDQACSSWKCYDSTHQHSRGGGNYWVEAASKKNELIRAKFPAGSPRILAGEGSAENWLPFMDAFLTLQVSRERYAGVRGWQTIPLFQSVYHEYAITFGNYSSLLSPPYDEKWPREFAPADAETPLDTAFNKQFMMEQARSFVWGIQPMISNYQPFLDTIRRIQIDYISRLAAVRKAGLQYFLHGEFMRPPIFNIPEEKIAISKLSIYAGRNENVTRFEKSYPQTYAGAWKSKDGRLAIALASISDKEWPVNFELNTRDYGIGDSGEIYMQLPGERKMLGRYREADASVSFTLPARGICFVELVPRR